MISIPMTQLQFNCAKFKLSNSEELATIMEHNNRTGVLKTTQIQADYNYNPDLGELQLNITHRHGIAAQMASENFIRSKLVDMLQGLDCSEAEADLHEHVKQSDIKSGSSSEKYPTGAWTEAGDGTSYPDDNAVSATPSSPLPETLVPSQPNPLVPETQVVQPEVSENPTAVAAQELQPPAENTTNNPTV